MDEIHRELLRKRQKYVLDNVIIEESLITALHDGGVFTNSMVQIILSEKDGERQLSRLLDMLPKRGPDAYTQFLAVLQKDYPWVVEHLNEKEADMRGDKGSGSVLPEVRRTVREYVKELAKTTRINTAQQRAIEDFLCRHTQTDTNTNTKHATTRLFQIHKLLMTAIPVSSLDESDQMELKHLLPDSVSLDRIEKEVTLLTQRIHDLQSTIDSCYEKLGETNKEKELPDIIHEMRKLYLEREIQDEEVKSQLMTSTKQLRLARDRARKVQEQQTKQEEEKVELANNLEQLKVKIQRLQEERQRIGMRMAFEKHEHSTSVKHDILANIKQDGSVNSPTSSTPRSLSSRSIDQWWLSKSYEGASRQRHLRLSIHGDRHSLKDNL